MKSGAIFDMDGLLFDTERVYDEEWRKVGRSHGFLIDDKMLDETRGANGEFMNRIINKYLPDADAARLTEEVFENSKKTLAESVPVKPGVKEILKYFKENQVKMAVASSSPMELILHNLKTADIASYFDVLVSGEQVARGKPEPDIFLLAARKLGIKPQDCYVFEDGIHGVYGGVAAGCSTIMILDLVKPKADLYNICTGIYSSLLDVLEVIKKGEC